MLKKIFLVGCISLAGCQSPEQTDKQFQQNLERTKLLVEGLKAAGVEAKVFANLRMDKIGSWETSLNGPGELNVIVVGEVEPEESATTLFLGTNGM
jgi:hypothetical protein